MKISEVPQDRGMMTDDVHEVCYALDKDGRYVLAASSGSAKGDICRKAQLSGFSHGKKSNEYKPAC